MAQEGILAQTLVIREAEMNVLRTMKNRKTKPPEIKKCRVKVAFNRANLEIRGKGIKALSKDL